MSATDTELCAMFNLNFEELVKFRPIIDQARAETTVANRHQRNRSVFSKAKAPPPARKSE